MRQRFVAWVRVWLVRIGLWLAKVGGWAPVPIPPPPPPCPLLHLPADSQVELVRAIVQDITERYPESPGPVKAREALRVLLNVRPGARERDLNLLIELALQ